MATVVEKASIEADPGKNCLNDGIAAERLQTYVDRPSEPQVSMFSLEGLSGGFCSTTTWGVPDDNKLEPKLHNSDLRGTELDAGNAPSLDGEEKSEPKLEDMVKFAFTDDEEPLEDVPNIEKEFANQDQSRLAKGLAELGISSKLTAGLEKELSMDENIVERWMQVEPPEDTMEHTRWKVACVLESSPGQASVLLFVIIGVVLAGVEANHRAATGNEGEYDGNMAVDVLDTMVNVFLLLELIVKIAAFQRMFFRDPWNIVDLAVVSTSTIEIIYRLIFPNHTGTALRVIRSCRALRVFRFFRTVRELKNLVTAFVLAFGKVLYVLIFLLLILYVFAIVATLEFANDAGMAGVNADGLGIKEWFGSVQISMVTLFQVMTGDSWISEISRSVARERPGTWVFFLGFYLIAGLGVLNLFTAVIIEELAKQRSKKMREKERHLEEIRTQAIHKLLSVIEDRVDSNNDGRITSEELSEGVLYLHDPNNFELEKRLLRDHAGVSMKMVVSMAEAFIQASDDDSVQVSEFEELVNTAHHNAAKADVFALQSKVKVLESSVGTRMDKLDTKMDTVINLLQNSLLAAR